MIRSFAVLTIGATIAARLGDWGSALTVAIAWAGVQSIQLWIDQDTRVGEVWGTATLFAVLQGFRLYPPITAAACVAIFILWICWVSRPTERTPPD